MIHRWLCVPLLTGLAIMLPASARAQDAFGQPQLEESEQLSPSQIRQQPSRHAQQQPRQPAQAPSTVDDRWPAAPSPTQQAQPAAPAKPAPPKQAAAGAVACNGVFAKDSSHLALATRYDSRNVSFEEVDGPDGTKLMASVLFPKDPRRRLEVLWTNEAGRSDTALIAINGRSGWSAPKGVRLGQALAALEKANGKPFKLRAFDKDGVSAVIDWQGGALADLPGGCKIGIRLRQDAKASETARNAVSGETELASNDASLRAVKPTVSEILIGY